MSRRLLLCLFEIFNELLFLLYFELLKPNCFNLIFYFHLRFWLFNTLFNFFFFHLHPLVFKYFIDSCSFFWINCQHFQNQVFNFFWCWRRMPFFFANKHFSSKILLFVFVKFMNALKHFLMSMSLKGESTHEHCEKYSSQSPNINLCLCLGNCVIENLRRHIAQTACVWLFIFVRIARACYSEINDS